MKKLSDQEKAVLSCLYDDYIIDSNHDEIVEELCDGYLPEVVQAIKQYLNATELATYV
jgi:hypothetical protein